MYALTFTRVQSYSIPKGLGMDPILLDHVVLGLDQAVRMMDPLVIRLDGIDYSIDRTIDTSNNVMIDTTHLLMALTGKNRLLVGSMINNLGIVKSDAGTQLFGHTRRMSCTGRRNSLFSSISGCIDAIDKIESMCNGHNKDRRDRVVGILSSMALDTQYGSILEPSSAPLKYRKGILGRRSLKEIPPIDVADDVCTDRERSRSIDTATVHGIERFRISSISPENNENRLNTKGISSISQENNEYTEIEC